MRLTQLEYLLALNRYGSFSRAATELYVAQPSISRAIKDLENELGFLILNRDHSGISFTEKGRQVLTEVELVMSSLDRIRALVDNDTEELEGTLRVSSSSMPCSSILIEALSALNQNHPQIRISSSRTTRDSLLKAVSDGSLDIGVAHYSSIEREAIEHELDGLGLTFHSLFSDQGCFMCSTMHPLYRKKELTMKDLSHYPMVLVPAGKGIPPFEQVFEARGLPLNSIYIDDTEYRKFLEHSLAFSPCSVYAAQKMRNKSNFAVGWRSCKDLEWFAHIGWVQRRGELTPVQTALTQQLERCALNYQDIKM